LDQIPILKVNGFLLVTIQTELHDQVVLALQDDLTQMLSRTRARGVLIDISAVEIVDSFVGRSLAHIAAIARIMDAATVLVGMRPAVAITLLELGMTLKGIWTALNVDKGMKLLSEAVGEPGAATSPP
jgi:rsbT antagonist protein RsbS